MMRGLQNRIWMVLCLWLVLLSQGTPAHDLQTPESGAPTREAKKADATGSTKPHIPVPPGEKDKEPEEVKGQTKTLTEDQQVRKTPHETQPATGQGKVENQEGAAGPPPSKKKEIPVAPLSKETPETDAARASSPQATQQQLEATKAREQQGKVQQPITEQADMQVKEESASMGDNVKKTEEKQPESQEVGQGQQEVKVEPKTEDPKVQKFSRPCLPSEEPGFRHTPGGSALKETAGSTPQPLSDKQIESPQEKPKDTVSQQPGQATTEKLNESSKIETKQSTEQATEQQAETLPAPDKQAEASQQAKPADKQEEAQPSKESKVEPESKQDVKVEEPPDGKKESVPKKEEEVVEAPKHGHQMPSFDEWKQEQLAEQEKKTKQSAQSTHTPGTLPTKVKTSSKNRVNYASMLCGAKILAVNSEAKNPAFVLSENRDQYMINPCNAKKWFVVELCEPVQIRSLEIANFELFSSLPESFVVQISDRYPVKKPWKSLGTFHARTERNVQSFSVENEELYSKYIRVEMLSHYGSEHFCPLSIFRVYGTTVEEDYDDAESTENQHEDQDSQLAAASQEKPTNLFKSATDTVLSLVKTVLTVSDEDGQKQGSVAANGSAPVDGNHMNNTLGNISQGNRSAATQGKHTGPTMPDAGPGSVDSSVKTPHTPSQPQTPDVIVGAGQKKDASSAAIKAGNTAVEPPRTTDKGTSASDKKSLTYILAKCEYCGENWRFGCMSYWQSPCGYQRVMRFIYPTSCVGKKFGPWPQPVVTYDNSSIVPSIVPKGRITSASPSVVPTVKVQEELKPSETLADTVQPSSVNVAPIVKETPSHTSDLKASAEEQGKVSLTSKATPVLPSDSKMQRLRPTPCMNTDRPKSDVMPTQTVVTKVVVTAEVKTPEAEVVGTAAVTATPSPTKVLQAGEGITKAAQPKKAPASPVVTPSVILCGPDEKDKNKGCMVGPEVVQIRPTATPQGQATASVQIPTAEPPKSDSESGDAKDKTAQNVKTKDEQTEQKPPESPSKENAAATPKPDPSSKSKDIYAEAPSGEKKEPVLEHVTPPDVEEPAIRMSTGRKETAFMRLNNRIKALELNLNLSSRYLEELSQRYRRQMEEMYYSINKTIAKLANTSKSAEERDLKQQENIQILQRHIANLTDVVSYLQNESSNLHKKVIERHLFLMLIEAIVFITIMLICMKKNLRPEPVYVQNRTITFEEPIKTQPPIPPDPTPKHLSRSSSHHAVTNRQRSMSLDHDSRSQDDRHVENIGRYRTISDAVIKEESNSGSQCSEGNLTIVKPNIPVFFDTEVKSGEVHKKKKKKKHAHTGKQLCMSKSMGQLAGQGHKAESSSANIKVNSAGLIFGAQDSHQGETPAGRMDLSHKHGSMDNLLPSSCNFPNAGINKSCAENLSKGSHKGGAKGKNLPPGKPCTNGLIDHNLDATMSFTCGHGKGAGKAKGQKTHQKKESPSHNMPLQPNGSVGLHADMNGVVNSDETESCSSKRSWTNWIPVGRKT